jgi:hypothetical protein
MEGQGALRPQSIVSEPTQTPGNLHNHRCLNLHLVKQNQPVQLLLFRIFFVDYRNVNLEKKGEGQVRIKLSNVTKLKKKFVLFKLKKLISFVFYCFLFITLHREDIET